MEHKKINRGASHDTERRILKAAEKEFLIKGFAGARTSSIAEAAGVTHAMLHYYFRTKEKIFEKILLEKIEIVKELMLESLDDESSSLQERIERLIARHLDNVVREPLLPRFFISEMIGEQQRRELLEKAIGGPTLELFHKLQRELDEAYGRGEIVKIDARTLVGDIMSVNIFPFLMTPMVSKITEGRGSVDIEEFLRRRKEENITLIMKRLKP